MLTPEREKEIRSRLELIKQKQAHEPDLEFGMILTLEQADKLLSEIDQLREKLKVAKEVLEFTLKHGFYCGHDDSTWCEDKCLVVKMAKQALKTIQAKELRNDSDALQRERDQLRAELQSFVDENEKLLVKLQVAEEALDFAMRNARVCGHDDPSWCNSTCRVVWEAKNALKTIQGKEPS